MASSGKTTFEMLPDEVVTSILGFVGARDHSKCPGARLQSAKALIQAQLVCRRFQMLVHQVKSLDWPLRSKAEVLGLIAFVNHESFSVDRLNLIVSRRHHEIPHDLISSGTFLTRLPKSVSIYCVNPDKQCNHKWVQSFLSYPEPSRNLVESLLSGSSIETFRISALPEGLVMLEQLMQAPTWNLRHLDLSSAPIELPALNNLLQRCTHVEILRVRYLNQIVAQDLDEEAEVEVATLLVSSQTLRVLELVSGQRPVPVDIEAPNLVSLDATCQSLKLDTPLLQRLTLATGCLERRVVLVQPCQRLRSLCAENCSNDGWTEIVAPFLQRCPSLETLDVNFYRASRCTDIPVGRFLSRLPSGIKTLSLGGTFISGLGLAGPLGGHVLPSLRHLQIGQVRRFDSYFTLRSLCEAMSNLQILQVTIAGAREEERAGIVTYFRRDFKDIPELDIRTVEDVQDSVIMIGNR